MRTAVILLALGTQYSVLGTAAAADDAPLQKARQAMKDRDYKAARAHAADAVKANPADPDGHYLLGAACLGLRDNEAAVAAFREVLRLDPNRPDALDRLGDALLKLGQFDEAVKAFDAFLKAKPEYRPEHWRRGIALYYAGQYAEGAKQFEEHKKANPQDVENAVWHYLCNAKATNKETARKQLIDVTKDARVPMAEVQKLFAGTGKPEDVLAAAERVKAGTEAGTEARFYAHLYLALWAEAEGEPDQLRDHLTRAVETYPIGHYMWDVAAAHLATLKKAKK
jgi:lipoprotein NlpI